MIAHARVSQLSLLVVSLWLSAPLLAACEGVLNTTQTDAPTPILVTRERSDLPAGCSPEEVARVLIDFFDALRTNDVERLLKRTALSTDPDTVASTNWYAVNEPADRDGVRNFLSDTQAELIAYAATRQQQHERLQLRAVDVDPGEDGSIVGIVFYLNREADDLVAGRDHVASAKGSVDCATQRIRAITIMMWPAGGELEIDRHLRSLCPAPPAGSDPNAIVACARQ